MTAFSTELKRAMTARGITQTGLATRADYGRSPLARVIAGETLPTPEVAERLADALDWPGLLAKIVPSRSGTCELCGVSFVVAPRGHSRRSRDRRACDARLHRWPQNRRECPRGATTNDPPHSSQVPDRLGTIFASSPGQSSASANRSATSGVGSVSPAMTRASGERP
jgi:transcriptional regulator with XRE-family HTH domain